MIAQVILRVLTDDGVSLMSSEHSVQVVHVGDAEENGLRALGMVDELVDEGRADLKSQLQDHREADAKFADEEPPQGPMPPIERPRGRRGRRG